MFQMIERMSEDPPRSKEGEMLKTTTKEIEFTVECTLLEVLCVVDVKYQVTAEGWYVGNPDLTVVDCTGSPRGIATGGTNEI